MKLIGFDTVQAVVQIADLFEPIRQSLIDFSSDKLIAAPINLLHFDHRADAHIKIAALKGHPYFSIKVATMFPNNVTKGLAINQGAILLFDAQTGVPVAFIEDRGLLTDFRTGVAGALATQTATQTDSLTLAVLGTGAQAYYQVMATSQLQKIKELVIYGRNVANAQRLQERLIQSIPYLVQSRIVNSPEKAVKSAEVIICATSSQQALIHGDWLCSGQHITAVGADDTYKCELAPSCFMRADQIYLDSLESNMCYGEYRLALAENPLLLNKTVELGQAFINQQKVDRNVISIAKLVGLGVQDLVTASTVFSKISSIENDILS